MNQKTKRYCVRFSDREEVDMTYLVANGGGWDPSVVIRRAVAHYANHIRDKNAAEQKRTENFLSGKLSTKAKTPLLQPKAKAKAAAGKAG